MAFIDVTYSFNGSVISPFGIVKNLKQAGIVVIKSVLHGMLSARVIRQRGKDIHAKHFASLCQEYLG